MIREEDRQSGKSAHEKYTLQFKPSTLLIAVNMVKGESIAAYNALWKYLSPLLDSPKRYVSRDICTAMRPHSTEMEDSTC